MNPYDFSMSQSSDSAWLIDWLVARFHESGEKEGRGKVLQRFASFCQKYLSSNPPVQVLYLPSGVGVRLQDGTQVAISPQASEPTGRMTEMPAFNFFEPRGASARLDAAPYEPIVRRSSS